MKSIHIRDVEPAVLGALKRLARAHHRSLQGELHAILERAARLAPEEAGEESLTLVTANAGSKSSWDRSELYGYSDR